MYQQAGLFSAVVTGFTLESYTWLLKEPEDQSVELLTHISKQLSSFIITPALLNSTAGPPPVTSRYSPSAATITMNALWFLSLTLSLTAAATVILVQQWLRHYLNIPVATSEKKASLRQHRFGELNRWFVQQIISILSVSLQIALFLFLTGVTTLVWTLNTAVATVASSMFAVSAIGFMMATVMPFMHYSCPYRSPFAWLAYLVVS